MHLTFIILALLVFLQGLARFIRALGKEKHFEKKLKDTEKK